MGFSDGILMFQRAQIRHDRRGVLVIQPELWHRRQREFAFLVQPGHEDFVADYGPEAGGVDVTATLRRAGIRLEWPPRIIARQVAFLGIPRRTNVLCSSGSEG